MGYAKQNVKRVAALFDVGNMQKLCEVKTRLSNASDIKYNNDFLLARKRMSKKSRKMDDNSITILKLKKMRESLRKSPITKIV